MTSAALIGLGTMGPGIAATMARAGIKVVAYDASADQRAKALAGFALAEKVLDNLGVKTVPGGSITVADSLAACVPGADLVLENVPEKLELKRDLFATLESLATAEAILASDTSGIPISNIQAGLKHPGRVVGMHWSNPPQIIPLIEVIAGAETKPEVVTWMSDFVRRIGHLPVVIKKDVPGFVENRVLYSVMRECVDLVEQGVIDPADLDTCVSWGIGYKLAVIGPMALLDMAGLDIYNSVGSYLNRELCDRDDVAEYVTAKVGAGRLGMKTGGGIYDYTPEKIAELRDKRAGKLVAIRKVLQA